MRFGVNLMLFGDTVDRRVLDRFELIREIGYEGVEVPVFEPGQFDVRALGRELEQVGLQATASGALPPGSGFSAGDEARCAAADYLRAAVRVTAPAGGSTLCGPFYKPVGRTGGEVPSEEQRRRAAAALKPLADEAHERGVTIAIEPLNRFETDLLNTVADGIDFVRAIDSPGAGLLLDTFHMHIEEKDSARAVCQAAGAGVLAHFHAGENDRGVPGSGQVDWRGVAGALRAGGYDGWVVLETFNQRNEAIRRAVSCWRPFYESEEQFLREGLAFVKGAFAG